MGISDGLNIIQAGRRAFAWDTTGAVTSFKFNHIGLRDRASPPTFRKKIGLGSKPP